MTKVVLSNTLADLAERVKKSVAAQERAEATAVDEALAAGAMLLDARSQATHGSWLPFLERAGLRERHAQKLMQLARSGLEPATVAHLGGVKATLSWLRGLTTPKPGQALIAHVDRPPSAEGYPPFGVMVPAVDGIGFDMAFVTEGAAVDFWKSSVIAPEPMLWSLFFHLIKADLARLTFEMDDDADGGWADIVRGTGTFAEAAA